MSQIKLLAIAIAISAVMIGVAQLQNSGRSSEILAISEEAQVKAFQDPGLPLILDSKIAPQLVSEKDQSRLSGRGYLVLAGACTGCSIRSFDIQKAAKHIPPGMKLFVCYSAPVQDVQKALKLLNPASNTVIIADPSEQLFEKLNGRFSYRRAEVSIANGIWTVTRLQKYKELEEDFIR